MNYKRLRFPGQELPMSESEPNSLALWSGRRGSPSLLVVLPVVPPRLARVRSSLRPALLATPHVVDG